MVPAQVCALTIEQSNGTRATMLLDIAVNQALQSAGLADGAEADMVVGTTLGNMHGATQYYSEARASGAADIGRLAQFLPCEALSRVAAQHSMRGERLTVCSACASAGSALANAYRRITSGRSKRVIAGGFDALCPFVVAGFNSLRLVSSRECRPFDRRRDGLNPGEAAAVLVLESKETALERGCTPLARLASFGEALEAYHYTRADPSGGGLAAAFAKALDRAHITAAQLDHIHMHGTATQANDRSEYMACRTVLGERLRDVPVCSTKSMTGHTFGASAAVNAVFSILSISEGLVPATLFCEEPDPEFVGLSVSAIPLRGEGLDTVASCSLGFGGEASVLVFTKATT
jgi:3-oxoacyl-[acyl-carrier-protein] synthase II